MQLPLYLLTLQLFNLMHIVKSDGTTIVECIPLATMLTSYAILTCCIFLAKAF